MPEEVWITGMGLVTSIGIGLEEYWTAARAGRSGGVALSHPVLELGELGTRVAAPVSGFEPARHAMADKEVRILDIATQFAVAAAHEAVSDAGLEVKPLNLRKGHYQLEGVDSERLATVIGTGIGGFSTMVENVSAWLRHHRRTACKRYALPMIIPNAPAATVAIRFQAKAECKAVNAACASGAMAIGDAWRILMHDEADIAICGGTEAILEDPELFGLMGFDLLKTMTRRNDEPTRASRPFDRDRDGYLLSEGAGVLVLERATFARARGARPYGRLAGYASACDASSILQIDPRGDQVERAMSLALRRAGLSPKDVDHIHAHGTGTVENDRVEARAIRAVFGAHTDALPVTSTKSMTGHPIGASGPIGLISSLLTIRDGVIPPTINLENPDPACELDFVANAAREKAVRVAMTNALGFGGHNACLVVSAP